MPSGTRHTQPRRRNQLGNGIGGIRLAWKGKESRMSPGERHWGVDRGVRRMRPGGREAMVLSTRPPFARTERTCRRQ